MSDSKQQFCFHQIPLEFCSPGQDQVQLFRVDSPLKHDYVMDLSHFQEVCSHLGLVMPRQQDGNFFLPSALQKYIMSTCSRHQ